MDFIVDDNVVMRPQPTDDAADLGAIRARLDRPTTPSWALYITSDAGRDDLRAYLQACDALAARLAAVGDALMYAISIVCNIENPTVTQDVPWEPLRRRFLDQAHAALGPPAAEMALRVDAGAAGEGT